MEQLFKHDNIDELVEGIHKGNILAAHQLLRNYVKERYGDTAEEEYAEMNHKFMWSKEHYRKELCIKKMKDLLTDNNQ